MPGYPASFRSNRKYRSDVDRILGRYHDYLRVNDLSYYREVSRIRSPTWERMEFLGDAVIGLCAADDGYRTFPHHSERMLTRHRTKLVRGSTLAEMFRFCGLQRLVPGKIPVTEKLSEDMFEAFVGAIYLDSCFEDANTWFCAMARQFELRALHRQHKF
jgi:dsRNA-specific ribonuclease